MNHRLCKALGLIASLPQLQALHVSIDSEAPTGAAKLMSDWNILDNTELPQMEFGDHCESRCTSPTFWTDLCSD